MFKERDRQLAGGLLMTLMVLITPAVASAHEAYVLSSSQWRSAFSEDWYDFLAPLFLPGNLTPVLWGLLVALVALLVSFFFWRSKIGQHLATELLQAAPLAKLVIRLAFGAALLIGALSGQIFGPEMAATALPAGPIVLYCLYGISLLILLGWLTEIAAAAVILIYLLAVYTYGFYALTYLHFPIIAFLSLRYGPGRFTLTAARLAHRQAEETTGYRWGFGLALILAAILVKVMHPAVTQLVIAKYQLAPAMPELFQVAATLTELAAGLFVLVGFQTRSAALLVFVSLLVGQYVFSEPLWPHLPLYSLALYLFVAGPGHDDLDSWLHDHWRHHE